jgi:transposase
MVLSLVPSRLPSLIPRALRILRVLPITGHVTVEAVSDPCSAGFPTCRSRSWHVHSHYPRTLRVFRSHGRPVTIRVTVRRFRFLNSACTRKTFAERLDDASVYGRWTKRPGDLQHYLAPALGR